MSKVPYTNVSTMAREYWSCRGDKNRDCKVCVLNRSVVLDDTKTKIPLCNLISLIRSVEKWEKQQSANT